jgi:hypothetical protein
MDDYLYVPQIVGMAGWGCMTCVSMAFMDCASSGWSKVRDPESIARTVNLMVELSGVGRRTNAKQVGNDWLVISKNYSFLEAVKFRFRSDLVLSTPSSSLSRRNTAVKVGWP